MLNMLVFYCNRCSEMITGGDYESTEQIIDRLDEHIKKCPPATFTFDGTTGVATQRLDALRSFHEDDTDDPRRDRTTDGWSWRGNEAISGQFTLA